MAVDWAHYFTVTHHTSRLEDERAKLRKEQLVEDICASPALHRLPPWEDNSIAY